MRQETDQLWAQVVEWRKRELNQWKDILQNTIKQEGRKAREIFPQLFLSLDSDDLEVVRLAAINFIIEAKLGCPNGLNGSEMNCPVSAKRLWRPK